MGKEHVNISLNKPTARCEERDCSFRASGHDEYDIVTQGVTDHYGSETAVEIHACAAHVKKLTPNVDNGLCNSFNKVSR